MKLLRWISYVGMLGLMIAACGTETGKVASFQQGECSKNLPLIPHAPEANPVTISAEGLYVNVLYKQAHFRCEQKVHFVVAQEGAVIKVTARPIDMNPSAVAACDCQFDLTGKVGPFEAGSYTVKVYHQTDNYGSPSETKEIHSVKLMLSASQ